jgi:hypothetical protein
MSGTSKRRFRWTDDLLIDGFTMAQWNDALYRFCNGESSPELSRQDRFVRNHLIFLMRQRVEEEKKKAKEEDKKCIIAENSVAKQSREVSNRLQEMTRAQLRSWQIFYKKFGIQFNASKVKIPEHVGGFDRLIVVAQRLRPQQALNICQRLFDCNDFAHNLLDQMSISEDRNSLSGAYAIWAKDDPESDEGLSDISAKEIYRKKIDSMSLTERLIDEAKYFIETGKHLDMKRVTMCASSRKSGNLIIATVTWGNMENKLKIGWRGVEECSSYFSIRRVIV